jgi:hypothetical protein
LSHDARRLRICARIQTLARKPVHNSRAPLTLVKFLVASSVNQFRCESFRIVYSLSRPQRPRSQDQRGFRNGASVQIGGGVHVGDASTSDCRIKTHSNVGTVALCLNVSKRDLSLALKRHLESCPDRHDGEAERTTSTRAGIRLRRGCRLDTQDLVVSNHGRTGRYHVLRTQRGIESRLLLERCRFRSVRPPASRV